MAPTPEEAVKLSMRIDAPLWRAWIKLAEREHYDPIDRIKMMMSAEVINADPPVLEDDEKARFERLNRLIRTIVEIAVAMFRNGEFTSDITLHVFQRAMADDAFRKDYTDHIGGADPYTHGNPLKEVNRELGWRIKNAIPVEVVKDDDGKPVEVRNLKGQVIQSYTRLRLREDA